MRSYEFYIKPAPGECTQADISLPQPQYAVISGHATDGPDPAEGALVLLMEQESGKLLQHTVTDSLGRFWFGPLPGDTLYLLRIQKHCGQTQIVELCT